MQSSGNQKTTSTTTLPSWYTDTAKIAMDQAKAASANLAQPYMGNTVAGLDPITSQAINLTGQNMGATNGTYTAAGNVASGVAGYQPMNFLQGNVSAYMNPYLQNVEQSALNNLNTAYKQNLNTIGDQALNANAFGGSRQGIAEGVAAAENARQAGDLSAQIRAQGYQQAAGMMQSDMDRALQGQQLNLQGAQMMGSLATAGQNSYLQSLQAGIGAGQLNQDQQQAILNQNASQFDAMRNLPLEQLNILLAALGGTQVPSSTTQTTPTSGSGFLSGLGGLLSGVGAIGSLSDKRTKTNIEKLGTDETTGLPIYSYDYKDDVKRAKAEGKPMGPKRVGPMAQDIAEMYPDHVGMVGGKLTVKNLGFGV